MVGASIALKYGGFDITWDIGKITSNNTP